MSRDAGFYSGLVDNVGRPIPGAPNLIRVGASAVVFDGDGRVLLEKRSDNGWWGLPGGAVDVGESVEQAVVREVFEETGLTVTAARLVGIYSDPRRHAIASYPDGNVVHAVSVCFECEVRSGDLRLSDESMALRYFRPDELPDQTLPGHVGRIRDALEKRPEAFVR